MNETPKVLDYSQLLPQPWWQKWLMEILCTTFLAVYGINFLLGSRTNLHIATSWGKIYNELFVEHFAKVGFDTMLTKQTQNVYSMRATGRINCIGLQAVLKLRRRQDILSRIWDIFNKPNDTLVIDVAMVPEMEPMVFVIVPIKSEKSYRKSNKDIEKFATPRPAYQKLPNFPESLSILSDSDEVVEALLIPKVVKVIGDYKNYIEAIHFTDHFNHMQYNKVLRFIFKLPPNKMEDIMLLTKMALFFIDQVAAFTLSITAKKKAMSLRTHAQLAAQKEKSEERQEAIQKRQEEKRKKEHEKYDQMTPEQRAKEDQKRAKRDAKKANKLKVVYG